MNRISTLAADAAGTATETTGGSGMHAVLITAAVLLFIASASALTALRGLVAALANLATLTAGVARFLLIALFVVLLAAVLAVSRDDEAPGPSAPPEPMPVEAVP